MDKILSAARIEHLGEKLSGMSPRAAEKYRRSMELDYDEESMRALRQEESRLRYASQAQSKLTDQDRRRRAKGRRIYASRRPTRMR